MKSVLTALQRGTAVGNNFSYPTPWVFDISAVARNYMNVEMKNGLAGGLADISPDVVTVGAKFVIQDRSNLCN